MQGREAFQGGNQSQVHLSDSLLCPLMEVVMNLEMGAAQKVVMGDGVEGLPIGSGDRLLGSV